MEDIIPDIFGWIYYLDELYNTYYEKNDESDHHIPIPLQKLLAQYKHFLMIRSFQI